MDDLDNVLDKWIFFIKQAGKLKEIPERLNEEPFRHAFEKARVANMDLEEFELYEKAGMAITDARGAIELARDEGRQEGHQKGRQEGRQENAVKTLLSQLEHRFGKISNKYRKKISNADLSTLGKWSLRILNAKSLKEVMKDQDGQKS